MKSVPKKYLRDLQEGNKMLRKARKMHISVVTSF